MNKRKKIIIITSSLIAITLVLFLIAITTFFILSYDGYPGAHRTTKYPFKDSVIKEKKHTFTQRRQNNKNEFYAEEIIIQLKKISKNDYINANLINVFYDFHFNAYYKLIITLIKDSKKYDVKAIYRLSHEYVRQHYVFDFEIEGQVYENCFALVNKRSGQKYFFIN